MTRTIRLKRGHSARCSISVSTALALSFSGVTLCALLSGCADSEEPLAEPEPGSTSEPEADEVDTESEGPAADDTEDNDDLTDTEVDDTGSESPDFTCEIETYDSPDADAEPFSRLEAVVVDLAGNPVPNITAQTCGLDVCLFGSTDDVGYVLHADNRDIKKAAFKYGDGVRYAQFALPLTGGATHELGSQVTFELPPYQDGPRFEPGASLESDKIVLTLSEDVAIEFDLFDVTEDEQRFTAIVVEERDFPEAVPEELGFELLLHLGPFHTKFCPAAELELPNVLDYADGTELEVFIHGTHVNGQWAPYAEWRAVAEAVVDGDVIRTTDDTGLPMLGAIGIKPKTD